jgi:hypothetical protein
MGEIAEYVSSLPFSDLDTATVQSATQLARWGRVAEAPELRPLIRQLSP